jgi:hypothetical protein
MGVNKVSVGPTDINVRAFLTALTFAPEAKVGYPAETTGPVIHDEAGVPLATLAAWNELGTEDVPPRPFMKQGADIFATQAGLMVPAVRQLAQGRMEGKAFIVAAGLRLKGAIEAAVKRQDFEPLSQVTIDRKGSSEILVDTNEMVNGLDVHIENAL